MEVNSKEIHAAYVQIRFFEFTEMGCEMYTCIARGAWPRFGAKLKCSKNINIKKPDKIE